MREWKRMINIYSVVNQWGFRPLCHNSELLYIHFVSMYIIYSGKFIFDQGWQKIFDKRSIGKTHPRFDPFSFGQRKFSTWWSAWLSDQQAPMSSQYCSKNSYTDTNIRIHNTNLEEALLASSLTKDSLQNINSNLPMFRWTCAYLPPSLTCSLHTGTFSQINWL